MVDPTGAIYFLPTILINMLAMAGFWRRLSNRFRKIRHPSPVITTFRPSRGWSNKMLRRQGFQYFVFRSSTLHWAPCQTTQPSHIPKLSPLGISGLGCAPNSHDTNPCYIILQCSSTAAELLQHCSSTAATPRQVKIAAADVWKS